MKTQFVLIFSKTSLPVPPSNKCSFPQSSLSRRQCLIGEIGNAFLHIFTTTDHITEPVLPIHVDLVFWLKTLCFFHVCILKGLEEMFIFACFLWAKAKQYSYFQLWVRAAPFSFRLIDFYCAFYFPCKRKLQFLFSIYSYTLIHHIHICTPSFTVWLVKSSLHSNQWQESTGFKSRISSTVTENKALSSLQFWKGTTSFSNKHG